MIGVIRSELPARVKRIPLPLADRNAELIGGRNRDRTCDLCNVTAALSQLSYAPEVETHSRSTATIGQLSKIYTNSTFTTD